MSKKPICKWESTCDDECRRPYGRCPKNCKNYKPYVSIEELEKENEQRKKQLTILEKRINTLKIKNASLERKNEEQKAQNERLKCCGNCKHWNNEGIQKYCVVTKPDFLIKRQKDICDKWEIVE